MNTTRFLLLDGHAACDHKIEVADSVGSSAAAYAAVNSVDRKSISESLSSELLRDTGGHIGTNE